MAKLCDLVSVASIGKRNCDVTEVFSAVKNRVPSGTDEFMKKLKVTVQVNSLEETPATFKSDSRGIFAPWCDNLNKEPQYDLFESKPLNNVKTVDESAEVRDLELALKLNEWRKEVAERINTFFQGKN